MIDRLHAEDVIRNYNSNFSLRCSLEISRGPLYTIIGPNGSGKSTLLRMLSLTERPDSGTLIYYDNGISFVNPHDDIRFRRRMVIVPARTALFSGSVYENIAYGLKIRKFPGTYIRQQVERAVYETGLQGKEDSLAIHLSSGEAQRLALARALAINPDILLLDEPTASIDPVNAKLIEEVIKNKKRDRKGIMVMVTHNIYQARALSDFVIFMYQGQILEFTEAGSFFKMPSTVMAGKFVSGEVY